MRHEKFLQKLRWSVKLSRCHAMQPGTVLVNHLTAVLVIVDLIHLKPGLNRGHVTTLNRCVPHGKRACCSFFGRFTQIILDMMLNSGFVHGAIITISLVKQRNIFMTQDGLADHIKAMVCIRQNRFSSSFDRQLDERMKANTDLK